MASPRYTTVAGLLKYLKINKSVLEFQPGQIPQEEQVAPPTVSAGVYYLDYMGVNADTLVLKKASDGSTLTLTTHYTFDPDTSAVTITAAGASALSGSALNAVYEYSLLGKEFDYTQASDLLVKVENGLDDELSSTFADQTSTNPIYDQYHDDPTMGKGYSDDMYSTKLYPIVKLQTTTNGAYTAGASTITLTSGAGFPQTGYIYIGGNEVQVLSRSGNVLTITPLTVNIADKSVVRGEIVKISLDPRGLAPSYSILTPDTHYVMDYNTGMIQLFDDYFLRDAYGIIRPVEGVQDRMRITYMQAWHQVNAPCSIPDEIPLLVYIIASRKLSQQAVFKNTLLNRAAADVGSLRSADAEFQRLMNRYNSLKISRS